MHPHSELSIPLGQALLHIPKAAISSGNSWDVQRHCNAEWEFHFIIKGTCHVYVDQSSYQLHSGQGLLIEPGRYHQAKALSGEFKRFNLGFALTPGAISRQLSEKTAQCPVFTPRAEVVDTVDRIMAETAGNRPYSEAYLSALICCLAVELLRSMEIDGQQVQKTALTPDILLTQQIDTYFEQHFADSCGETELAKQLHFSRRHLVRILKKHYNISFREKLLCTRLDYAAFLLRTTDLPVSTIATEVGYGSESAFFKVFRRSFGMTPRQYRTHSKEK